VSHCGIYVLNLNVLSQIVTCELVIKFYLLKTQMLDRNIVDVLIRNSHSHGEGKRPGTTAPVPTVLVRVLKGIRASNVELSVTRMLINRK